MQESEDPPVRLSKDRKIRSNTTRRSGRRRGVVLLVSTNPLALPELQRLARTAPLRCRPHYLKLNLLSDVDDIRVPRARVLVLDSFSTGPLTEKVVASIRTHHPRACVIVLVSELGDSQAFALLQLGVKGILTQRDINETLGQAIGFVAKGGVRMPRGLMARYLDSSSALGAPAKIVGRRLSQRERQVLEGVVKSESNKEIANHLHISEATVKFHLARVFRKYGVRRRAELIVQAGQESASAVLH
jgi:two-component system, NarL family, nitrate/nitrite response regulator NarL